MKFSETFKKRNRLLYYAALAHVAGALLMVLLMVVDDTQVLGINRWMKPFKFFLSISIYLITFCWLSGDLPASQNRFVRIFSWQVILAMVVEMAAIVGQAARAEVSHFNRASIAGGIIFGIMGLFILYNTIWVAVFTFRYWKHSDPELPRPYALGARLGLLLFLLGGALGGYMSAQTGHTVGGADGGPGLPLVNWSTRYGDLRVAHFLGLHGIQLLLLLGYWVSGSRFPPISRRRLVWLSFWALLTVVLWGFLEAVRGIPLVRI
jgi:hypothetical protein